MAEHHSISELNDLYSEGEGVDQELFAEQRSNVQLVAGEHYMKKGNRFWNRLRDNKDLTNDQKLRLTKNHIRKIVHIYRNGISSYSPGVFADPKDKSSLQNQKAAELVNAVWADGKQRFDFNDQINKWISDYIGIGEVAVKIFFDPMAGKFLGYEQAADETGMLQVDEHGQPMPSENAKFQGEVIIERIFAFNLIRPSFIKDMSQSPWFCHRKMVDVSEVKALIDSSDKTDDEKAKLKSHVTDTMDQTYVVLDGNSNKYKTTKNQTMLKEWFFKPCVKYPNGYFYICTPEDIIFEGELPFGIFPIIYKGFDEIQTSPRARSLVKQLRPYQVEINRCASTIAEHQITMGWDKVLVQNGTKLQPGVTFPGVRSFSYSGMAPVIMEGRTGNQYLEYMNSQIDEIYKIANVEDMNTEKEGQYDVYSMLSRSIKDKKKFSLYSDGFESFLKKIFETYIKLRQKYSTAEELIPAIGKAEYINVSEFKNVEDICYSIVPEAQCDDSEAKLGKQLMLNHIIQYVGPQLQKDDIGKLIRLMPYANDEMILEDLTMDYDVATNYILALDRGELPEPNTYDNHEYLIKKLTSRTRKADFKFMDQEVKNNYEFMINMHENIQTQNQMKLKQAESEFIPTGGYLVACDFYVPDPNNPQKLPKRVRLPSEAMNWLINQLNSQGSNQEQLQGIPQGSLASMSDKLEQSIHGQQQASPQQSQLHPQPMGAAGAMPRVGMPNMPSQGMRRI